MIQANPSNPSDRRRLVRPAARIFEALLAARRRRALVRLPQDTWEECQDIVGRLREAERREWQAAAAHLRRNLTYPLASLIGTLQESARSISEPPDVPPTLNLRAVLDELASLEAEFSEFNFDLEEHRVWVITDEIALEGVVLGRFRIVLNWTRLGDDHPYEVQAEDPNPASGDESVTHPHVRDDGLCEGDGKSAIRAALAEGRLFDFFVLVRQILGNYNPGSAYVRLKSWNGVGCADCGDGVPADEATSCERCESDLCYDCSSSCGDCGRTCCSECRSHCTACDESFCEGCLLECDDCENSFCSGCLTDGLCESCRETSEETDENLEPEIPPQATPAAPDAEIHADRVGKVGVPA